MKDLKVLSALEVIIVVPSGDLWKGQFELEGSSESFSTNGHS